MDYHHTTVNKDRSDMKWMIITFLLLGGVFIMILREQPVMRQYGFKYATPVLQIFPCKVEPLMITEIKMDSAFHQAGFKSGDIIVKEDYFGAPGFIRRLKHPTGDTIHIKVVPADQFYPSCDSEVNYPTEIRAVIVPQGMRK